MNEMKRVNSFKSRQGLRFRKFMLRVFRVPGWMWDKFWGIHAFREYFENKIVQFGKIANRETYIHLSNHIRLLEHHINQVDHDLQLILDNQEHMSNHKRVKRRVKK